MFYLQHLQKQALCVVLVYNGSVFHVEKNYGKIKTLVLLHTCKPFNDLLSEVNEMFEICSCWIACMLFTNGFSHIGLGIDCIF